MKAGNARIVIIITLVLCSGLNFIYPAELTINTDVLFEDNVLQRIEKESDDRNDLILLINHDDDGPLTNNLSRVQHLLDLEKRIINNINNSSILSSGNDYVSNIKSPLNAWSEAFKSVNRSLENATKWADVLQPIIKDGWCGENTTIEEEFAFISTMLLLPNNLTFNVACPSISSDSSPNQAPSSNELIWMINVNHINNSEKGVEWSLVLEWAEKMSDETEFKFTPAGVNMLFGKAQKIAKEDIESLLLPSILLLIVVLTIGLKDLKTSIITISSVGLIVAAEIGLLSSLGFSISIVDTIAIPIIMGVAVDGAFWYCKSSRKKEEVRKMLLIAMITTVAAISLALFSPIKAQRSLALMMIVGIVVDWVVTRYLLEDYYLSRRNKNSDLIFTQKSQFNSNSIFWPVGLIFLAIIAVISPPSVDVLDVKQFLSDDDPALDELKNLESNYILGSGSQTWIVIDAEGDNNEDLERILNFQEQLSNHLSIMSIDSGLYKSPLIVGLNHEKFDIDNDTIDSINNQNYKSLMNSNPVLRKHNVTTGVLISVIIDGQNSDAAVDFANDVRFLLSENNLEGEIGGDLISGSELAMKFAESRFNQIILAGIAVFIVTSYLLRSPYKASRIAVGTIAVGIAVDGMATIIGSRGVHTAPAVLLGMGFAADYLSHASGDHYSTKQDNLARWGAAISSASVFILLGIANFPPAQNTGRLLTLSIIFAALLATFLSLTFKIEENEE